jgi:Enoyl-(Acyl carrier protein) reductase
VGLPLAHERQRHVPPLQGEPAPHAGGGVDHQHGLGQCRSAQADPRRVRDHEGAIVNFTAGLAQLVGERGIRVNSVLPGPVWTPLIPATLPPDQVEGFGRDTPLGRPAQPAELAPIYVLLASDEASYMSGSAVAVTGGRPVI